MTFLFSLYVEPRPGHFQGPVLAVSPLSTLAIAAACECVAYTVVAASASSTRETNESSLRLRSRRSSFNNPRQLTFPPIRTQASTKTVSFPPSAAAVNSEQPSSPLALSTSEICSRPDITQ